MAKSQMSIDFDKWLSGYTGSCSDNHALYQAFCAGYEAAQQSVQPTDGILPDLQASSIPEVNPAPEPYRVSPTSG